MLEEQKHLVFLAEATAPTPLPPPQAAICGPANRTKYNLVSHLFKHSFYSMKNKVVIAMTVNLYIYVTCADRKSWTAALLISTNKIQKYSKASPNNSCRNFKPILRYDSMLTIYQSLIKENITRWCKHMKFTVSSSGKIIYSFTAFTHEIVFPWEDKLHIFKPTCNLIFITS